MVFHVNSSQQRAKKCKKYLNEYVRQRLFAISTGLSHCRIEQEQQMLCLVQQPLPNKGLT